MRLFNNTPRLIWLILVPALLLSLVAAAVVANRDLENLKRSHKMLAESLLQQTARAGHLALLAGDAAELHEIARSVLRTDPVLGSLMITHRADGLLVNVEQSPQSLGQFDAWCASLARLLSWQTLPMTYSAQIPPPGEGSLLDPFGTARADIGLASIELSQSRLTHEFASSVYYAMGVWLLLFFALTATGYGIAWVATLPMLHLGRRLSAIAGDDDIGTDYAEIERNLATIGQRLSRSEDQAREATAALHGQSEHLAQAREHARNATKMRADLVAGMSHELRTPLTAILGHSDLLARSGLDRRQQEYVGTVRKSARNLLSLIDDVLEWSGIEAGKANLNDVGFNLAEIVEDTIDLLAPLAFEKDLELTHMIYQDVPLRLRGDPQRFQQILTNLVSNAIKFTHTGGITVRIMVEDEHPEKVEICTSVADTGPGISAEAQRRLFDMYERLDNVATIGSGLGLAISKKLLEMMGGEIRVESEPGSGSNFEFNIPFAKALHREQNSVPWSGLRNLTLWVHDDYHTSRVALAHHLEAWQLKVIEMETRQDFLGCLEDGDTAPRADLAILGMSAADSANPATIKLLEACRAAELPSLAMVTSIDPDVHSALTAAGASASLPKSANRLQLYKQLCELAGIDETPETGDTQPLSDLHALVADNSAAARGYLTTLLTGLGAGVAQAEDGKTAVDAWRKGTFPLVLLDAQMPGTDGAQAALQIRELAPRNRQPILIGITADSRTAAHKRLLAAGMDACLVKPFNESQLLRALAPLLPRLDLRGSAKLADETGHRAEHLVADPKLALLLATELPAQCSAVEAAVEADDANRAKAEIHTLHGTAAFYGLQDIRVLARAVEDLLLQNEKIEPELMAQLRSCVTLTVATLAPEPEQPAANS